MAISPKIQKYLTTNKVKSETVPHRKVFTVYDLSQTLHVKLNTIAKTLLMKADKDFHLVVVPAHRRLDLAALKKVLKAKKVSFASEKDMVSKLKVKPGALTAFGSMHKLAVVADKGLLKTEKMLFGAGSFTESLRLKVKDYIKSEQPTTGAITTKA